MVPGFCSGVRTRDGTRMTGWSECAPSWTWSSLLSGVGAVPPDPLAVVARGRVRLDEPARGEPAFPAPDRAELAEQHRVQHQLVAAGRGLEERRRPFDLCVPPPARPRLLPAALLAQVVDGDEEFVVEALLGQRVLERLAERLDAYRGRAQTNRKLGPSTTPFCKIAGCRPET
ncbi:hypothetical protein M885DRAFT_542579 [Pelagophyceae sp. CCMP2097]|nr:hypothetical protein M885DRAFT_542579 [Pelagophyceae sp. CCMP2097]